MDGFQPLQPKKLNYVDVAVKHEIDWRSCCMVLANSHLGFVDFVMKACPNNPAIQALGTDLRERLGDVIATGVINGAKK